MTPDELTALLDRDQFDQYLRALPPGTYIGKAKDACDCPLAHWLKMECGAPVNLEVGEDTVVIGWDSHGDAILKVDLPEWAKTFVRAIDQGIHVGSSNYRCADEGVRIMNSLDIMIAEYREEVERIYAEQDEN